MEEHNLTNEQILAFSTALFQAERSQATVEKYLRSVQAFSLSIPREIAHLNRSN